MALGSHLITVRRLEKYINDVIGKKANLPDTSKTIIGNISQINSDLTYNPITGLPSTAQSSITIPLPANFKEMVLLVKVGGNSSWTLSSTIYGCTVPTSGSYIIREGQSFYYAAGQTRYDAHAEFDVSANGVTITGSLSANNVTNASTVLVAGWYR